MRAATIFGLCFSVVLLLTGCSGSATTDSRPDTGIRQQDRVLMVGGSVETVDLLRNWLTITTPMGKREMIRLDENTQVYRGGVKRSISDLGRGADVKVDYVMQPDGRVRAQAITIGHVVPSCSCGTNCSCPLSRGCKVVRY